MQVFRVWYIKNTIEGVSGCNMIQMLSFRVKFQATNDKHQRVHKSANVKYRN